MSIIRVYGMSDTVVLSENSYYFGHNRDIFVFSVSIMGISGMPYIVVLSENILGIALCVKHPKWPPFAQGQAINSYNFRHNRGRFLFLVSIMGFSGTLYIVVLSENILDIALWVKNSRWLLFVKGRSINEHHFWQNWYRTVISVSIIMFYGTPGLMVWSGST